MGRRASGQRKKGKCVRRAQAGAVGERVTKTSFTGQYGTRAERRAEKIEERRDLEKLRAAAAGQAKDNTDDKIPRSFVFHRGKVGKYLLRLVQDFRKLMEPFTASKLKVLKRNNLRDFVVNAAPLGVTHMVVLTRSDTSPNMRIIRNPQGPTVSFRVLDYTLSKHVLSSLRRPVCFQEQLATQPLVVMNNFNHPDKKHLQLVQTVFQNMFPSINVDTMQLSRVRRCVLINYNTESDSIDVRHYAIKTVPSGLSKSTKKLVQSKVPDLSKYKDISDYFLNPGQLSESEYEQEQKDVELTQDLKARGCKKGQQTSIRLIELGPRLTLQLLKIEEGLNEGEVLFHSLVTKSPAELIKLRQQVPKNKKLKERRRKAEEHRVIGKLKAIEDEKQREENRLKEERERLVNRQKAVAGQNDQENNDRQEDTGKDKEQHSRKRKKKGKNKGKAKKSKRE